MIFINYLVVTVFVSSLTLFTFLDRFNEFYAPLYRYKLAFVISFRAVELRYHSIAYLIELLLAHIVYNVIVR